MSDPDRWTTASDIRSVVKRRWDDGSLLRSFALGELFPPIDLPLRHPVAQDLGDHFDRAREWSEKLRRASRDGRAYELREGSLGGRLAGRTGVPDRAVIAQFEQAWALLDTAAEAAAYRRLIAETEVDAARQWALAHPIGALSLSADWAAVQAAYTWLDAHRGSALYVRQVSAPGVDTKFIDAHRAVLAAMLGVPSGAAAFLESLGLAQKPATVRLRFDPAVFGLPHGVTEAVFRADELDAWHAHPVRALIVENEISYLSVPVPENSVVLWGRGFDVERSSSLSWLGEASIYYWGDLDSYGFAILNRVRAHLPDAVSVLMDRETLLAHEARWGHEPKSTAAVLDHLTGEEASLYADLVSDRYGPRIRLEQERIDWEWALRRLTLHGVIS